MRSALRKFHGWLLGSAILALLQCFFAACVHADEYQSEIRPILVAQCLDCHNGKSGDGNVDLARFITASQTLADRAVWKRVFDVIEAGQMPLQDSGYRLTEAKRRQLMEFSRSLQSQPDPRLGAMDPGRPVLRRLTRLEYNNTIRDLFGLSCDIFAFPERLPIADKNYFLSAEQTLGASLRTSMREYGQKTDLLLPAAGLPGDNRAEFGFANRGDVMNMSPLLLENYLELSAAISRSERLERESPVMAQLLGVKLQGPPRSIDAVPEPATAPAFMVATNQNVPESATGNDSSLDDFSKALALATEQTRGGVFDVPAALANKTVPAEGGVLNVAIGPAAVSINPNQDLWLAGFATADESSGSLLIANKVKGQKVVELTFRLENGGDDNGIEQLGLCILARRREQGVVTLTGFLSDGRELIRTATLQDANTFCSMAAPPGAFIRRLKIDGAAFSGDYVLIDDLAVILKRSTGRRSQPPSQPPLERSPAPTGIEKAPPVQSLELRMQSFLTRAYRRPVSDQELSAALSQVAERVQSGRTEAEGIRHLVQTVLASPDFLFLAEPNIEDALRVRPLNGYELASRLSYFLWASMPDDELLAAAGRGELESEEGLRKQVRRMLSDRGRIREFSESFGIQWLRLDQLYSAKPDPEMYKRFYSGPQGKSTLHSPMLTEALLLVETVLIENRSIIDLVDPDFTWLNSSLAGLYGLTDAYDVARRQAGEATGNQGRLDANEWYRVTLPDRSRGGVLTMAGPLTLTSLPHRTSPIKRGAWLLETILHRPPAEPKVAFVLEDRPSADVDPSTLTVRQRFELHRTSPNCASCHSQIDPPGFALESFDGIGAYRLTEGSRPVDATGVWNGVEFDGPAGFKQALRRREQDFVRGFVEHLLSYALGRPVEYFDMPAVSKIVEDSAAAGHRLSVVIEGIVVSYPFRHTRNLPGDAP